MASEKLKGLTVSVIPGTGNIGGAIVRLLSVAGLSVVLGSRDASKAEAAAAKLSESIKSPVNVKGLSNQEAAAAGDVIFWTPSGPLAQREAMLKALAKDLEGKIIIDTTNVLYFHDESDWGQVSASLLNQKALGVPARWVAGFNQVFQGVLEKPDVSNPYSVFVVGDDTEAVSIAMALIDSMPGFKAIKGGPLKNSKITDLIAHLVYTTDLSNFGGTLLSGIRFG